MAKIIFMGTPEFAVPTLEALIAHHEVTGIVTQPDRPAGRGGHLRMSPIKETALKYHIPVFQPKSLRREAAIAELKQWEADAYVVAAFGQILPQAVLDIPKYGSINVHASLLPRWRGAAPIHAAIRHGDTESGITIMKMDAGLDTGPMLSKKTIPIAADETAETLHDKLAQLGAQLLLPTLTQYFNGELAPIAQDDSLATYAPQIEKEDGLIHWSTTAVAIERLIRAYTPWPGTFTTFRGKQLKILSGKTADGILPCGEVGIVDGVIAIGTGEGVYLPQTVQLAGKKLSSIEDFANGYQDFIGATLSSEG